MTCVLEPGSLAEPQVVVRLALLMLGLTYQTGGRLDELRRIEASAPGLAVRASASPGMIAFWSRGLVLNCRSWFS